MTFAARSIVAGEFPVDFTLTPGTNGLNTVGYSRGTYGSVSPDPVNLSLADLEFFGHNSDGLPSIGLATSMLLPLNYQNADIYLDAVFFRTAPRFLNGLGFNYQESGMLSPLTIGVPVTVRFVFR